MSQQDATLLSKAAQVRDALVAKLIDHPDVTLIDIGHELGNATSAKQIAVRVHVRRSVTKPELGLLDEIDGVPISLVVADYHE